jgi:hypothetical protein
MEQKKVYTQGQVILATVLGSFLAGTILMYKNFQTFGLQSKAKQALIFGCAGTVLLTVVCIILPEDTPSFPFILVQIICIHQFFRITQGSYLKDNKSVDYTIRSWWSATGWGLLSCAIIIMVLIGIVFLLPEEWFLEFE